MGMQSDDRPVAALLLGFIIMALPVAHAQEIPLAGTWQFRIDRDDAGIREAWFNRDWTDRIPLPGAMAEYGYGDDVTADTPWTGSIVNPMWHKEDRFAKYRDPANTKILFWLQPDKHYVGPAWYQRDVEVPDAFAGKHVSLMLERPHWETRVWVDGHYAGMRNSLSVAHEYNVTKWMTPGTHRITLRVDNTVKIDVGENAHSVSDNTQGNWNGITGEMALRARPLVRVSDVQVYPDVATRSALLHVTVANDSGRPARGTLIFQAKASPDSMARPPESLTVAFDCPGETTRVEATYALGEDAQLWSEYTPVTYDLTADLNLDGETPEPAGTYITTFGLREIVTQGTQFTLNGEPIFLRGTLECCIFPKTGYPPTDIESWLRVMHVAKSCGLNHLRFHSWCPPEAAFAAADQAGMYLQVECAAWARIGDGGPIDQFIYDESDRIMRAYGNHPSFCLLAYGNEPAGRNQKRYLAKLVDSWKEKDNRRLYTAASGWPQIPESQYHVMPQPRVHAWGSGLDSRFNAEAFASAADYAKYVLEFDVPIISHEIGQYCVFPNLNEISKYTGYLKPKNFEIVADLLEANHLRDQAHDFLIASGKLQALVYKEEIEAALRTPGFGGFELLDLHDFPGQGTALVGVLDAFWEEKGYITATEFRRFSGPSVPLLRMEKCVWTSDETFRARAEITHYGADALQDAPPWWRISKPDGTIVLSGELPTTTIPRATAFPLGDIVTPLNTVEPPCQLRVELGSTGTDITNGWDIWLYAPKLDTEPHGAIHIAQALDEGAMNALQTGGKVLLLPEPGAVKGDARGPVPPAFSPIFWNTFWTNFQPPHTLGILCDPKHPALAEFPTEFHSNWQWWEVIHAGQIMILDALPPELRPIVQVIDDWNTCRRLGLAFEARVNGGSLLVCSAEIASALDTRPVARQLRRSLLDYMASPAFAPEVSVAPESIHGLFRPVPRLVSMGATATASSAQTAYEAPNAIDGNPDTFWHTPWKPEVLSYPHWLAIDLQQPVRLRGIRLLPRQDMTNGRIGEYAICVSKDGVNWGRPILRERCGPDTEWQTVNFNAPVTTRHIKIQALAPQDPAHPWATLAEVDVLPDGE